MGLSTVVPAAQAAANNVYYVNSTAAGTAGTCTAGNDTATGTCTLGAAIVKANSDDGTATVKAATGFTGTITPSGPMITGTLANFVGYPTYVSNAYYSITSGMTLNLAGIGLMSATTSDDYPAGFYINATNVTITNGNDAAHPVTAGGTAFLIGPKANTVTLQDFTNEQRANYALQRFVGVVGGAQNVVIQNNTINGDAVYSTSGAAVYIASQGAQPTTNSLIIKNNVFGMPTAGYQCADGTGCGQDMILADPSANVTVADLQITGNTFQNLPASLWYGTAINLIPNSGDPYDANAFTALSLAITGNTFTNIAVSPADRFTAIMLPSGHVFPGGATVSNNKFDNSMRTASGGVIYYGASTDIGANATKASNLAIENNVIDGYGTAGGGGAIQFYIAGLVTVRNNKFGPSAGTAGSLGTGQENNAVYTGIDAMVRNYVTTNGGVNPWYPEAKATDTATQPTTTASLVNGTCQATFYVVPPTTGPKTPVDIDLYHTATTKAEDFVQTYTGQTAAFPVTVTVPASSIATDGTVAGGYRVQTQSDSGYAQTLSTQYSRLITITGNCANPGLLSITPATQTTAVKMNPATGENVQTFEVKRATGSQGTLSVNVALTSGSTNTANGQAQAGNNFDLAGVTVNDKAVTAGAPITCTWVAGNSDVCTVTVPLLANNDGATLDYTATLQGAKSSLSTSLTDATLIDQTAASAIGTLVDPPEGDFAITATNTRVDAGNPLTYEVTRTNGSAGAANLTVTLHVDGDTAVAKTNYTDAGPYACAWADGDDTTVCTITVATLKVADGLTPTLTATLAGNANIVTPTATGEIIDPGQALVKIQGPAALVPAGNPVVYTLLPVDETGAPQAPNGDIVATVTVGATGDTAVADTNYKTTTATCTLKSGSTAGCTVTVPSLVPPTGDGKAVTLTATVTSASNFSAPAAAPANAAQATIQDPSAGQFAITGPSALVGAGQPAVFTVNRLAGLTGSGLVGDVSVTVTLSDGTAKGGVNYDNTTTTFTCAWTTGQTTPCQISVPTKFTGDGGQYTFTATLSDPTGGDALIVPAQGTATATIADQDSGYFQITPLAQTVGAGDGITFTIARVGGKAGDVAVDFATVDGTALAGTNYDGTKQTFTWKDGDTTTYTVTVGTSVVTDGRSVTLQGLLSNPVGNGTYLSPKDDHGDVTIVDPAASTFSITTPTAPVTAGQKARFTIYRENGTVGAVSVAYSITGGTGVANVNYTPVKGTCSWGDGETAPCVVDVTTLVVPDGAQPTVTMTLASPVSTGNTATITTAEATATIANPPAAQFQIAGPTADVAAGSDAVFTVSRVTGSDGPASVRVTTADKAALAGTNYVAKTYVCAWADGDMTTPCLVPVTTIAQPDGKLVDFTATLSAPSGAGSIVAGKGTATASIQDPNAGTLAITGPTASVISGGQAVFTVSRTGGSAGEVTVKVATSNDPTESAKAGTNYETNAQTLTWADGDTADKQFLVTTKSAGSGQTLSFTAQLTEQTGGNVTITTASAPATIVDRPAGYFTVTTSGPVAAGNDLTFTVNRVGGSVGAVSVDFTAATAVGDSAVSGTNYTPASKTCQWDDGDQTPCVITVKTNLVNDGKLLSLTGTISNPVGAGTSITIPSAVSQIQDPAAGVFSVVGPTAAVAAGQPAVFTVTREGGSAGEVTVAWTTAPGDALAGTNYKSNSSTCVFPAGVMSCSISVDTVAVADGKAPVFSVKLTGATGGNPTIKVAEATATIQDPDQTQFQITGPEAPVAAGDPAEFTVSRVNGSTGDVSVVVTTQDGSAKAGSHYQWTTQTCSWADGNTPPCTVSVPTLVRSDGTTVDFTAVLSKPTAPAVIVTGQGTATATIQNPSAGQFAITGPSSLVGAGLDAVFTVDRLPGLQGTGLSGAASVPVTLTNGTATGGKNYDNAQTTFTCSWTDGDATPCQISVPTMFTGTSGQYTFTATLGAPAGGDALVVAGQASATATIMDKNSGYFQITPSAQTVAAGATITFTVARVGGKAGAVSVDVATVDGTAVAGPNYTTRSATFTWPDGDDTTTHDVTVPTTIVTDGKSLTLQGLLSNPVGKGTYLSPNDNHGDVTITDPAASTFSVTAPAQVAAGQSATFTITRDGGSVGAVGVAYSISGTAIAGTNYTPVASGTCNWADTKTAPCVVTVPTLVVADGAKPTLTLTLAGPVSAGDTATITAATAATTIVNPAAAQFEIAGPTADVAAGSQATFTVSRVTGSAGPASVTVTTTEGTSGRAGTNYVSKVYTCDWKDNDMTPCSVPVTTVVQPDGARVDFAATLSNPSGASTIVAGKGTATAWIQDPSAGTLMIAGPSAVVTSGDDAVFTVTRSGGSAGQVTVTVATVDGSAKAGTNYTGLTQQLTWANGDTAAKQVSVKTLFSGAGGQADFTAQLDKATGGNVTITTASAPATIQNRVAGYFTITGPSGPVAAGENLTFNVNRVGGSAGAVSVDVATVDGTAKAGTNYDSVAQTCQWADTVTTACAITVPTKVVGDGALLALTAALSNPVGSGTSVTVASVQGQIQDPSAGIFSVTGPTAPVTAGQPATFVITREGGFAGTVKVAWATANGTAKAGANYASDAGVCTFLPGQKTCTVTVDTLVVPDGTQPVFSVTLGSAVGGNATIAVAEAPATITDPAGTQFAITGPSTPVTAGSPAVFTVNRAVGTVGVTQVTVTTTGGTAVAGTNYTTTTVTCQWGDGVTTPCTVSVPTTAQPDGTTVGFTAVLSAPGAPAAIAADQGTASATIVNPSAGQFAITGPTSPVAAGTAATFAVTRSGGTAGTVSIDWVAQDGTALAGTNYTASAGTCVFPAGELTCPITVPTLVVADGATPGFTVQLTKITGGNATITGAQAAATIQDPAQTVFQITGPTATIAAGAPAAFTVNRTNGTTGAASVVVTTVDGSARAGTNYVWATQTCEWADGDASPCTVSVPTIKQADGTTVTFTAQLSDPSQPATTGVTSASATIVNPGAGTLSLNAPAGPVNAGGQAVFTVTRNDGGAGVVSVTVATADGTAIGGTNYTPKTQTLTWDDGDTSAKRFIVDTVFLGEGNELTFGASLTGATGGNVSVAPATATATIVDRAAGYFAVSLEGNSTVAAGGTLTFRVDRVGGSAGAVAVDFVTKGDTALAAVNYEAAGKTCAWADGVTTPCLIPVTTKVVNDGALLELVGQLVNPVGTGTSLGIDQAFGQIQDPSAGGFSVAGPADVVTAGQPAVFTITRTGGTTGAVTVGWTTTNGTGVAGTNYTAATGTCEFPDGVTTCTVKVPTLVVVDGLAPVFTLSLTSATGGNAAVIVPSANATIVDPAPIPVRTVTFDGNGGAPVSSTASVAQGGTVALPGTPTREGYIFTGWNTAAAGSGTWFTASTPVGADLTVYAQWQAILVPLLPDSSVEKEQIIANTTGGASRLANGTDTYTIYTTVVDQYGHPMTGLEDQLTLVLPESVRAGAITETATPGVYAFAVDSATPGNFAVMVLLDGEPVGQPGGQSIPVNFIAAQIAEKTRTPGEAQTVIGRGFRPGELVTVTLHSQPIVLGTFTADSAGIVTVPSFTLPADFALGDHTVVFQGDQSGTVTVAFVVVPVGIHSGGSVTGPAAGSGLALVLALAGLAAGVLLVRRRMA
ncbi:MAG: InlB B-repeat-containing protein [Propionibacteriaceae bacterium]|nr:InlB B-repeat-containing protein [Propionibacteriaceae bacterium]